MALLAAAQGPAREGGRGGFGPRMGVMSAAPGSRTAVTGAPYSGTETTETQQTLAGGNQIVRQDQSKVYRDSQGRVRIEHTMNAPKSRGQAARTVVTIFDPVGGSAYMLDPENKTAMKTPSPVRGGGGGARGAGPRPREARTEAAAMQTEELGNQIINGVSATGKRITQTIPAGDIGNQQPIQIVRETWVSIDLKVPVLIKSSDPRFGSTVTQLTNIVRAEPDASLFQVPPGYTVNERRSGMGEGPGPARRRR